MYKIPANTLFIGQKLVYVPECHSTNTLAMEMTQKEDLPEGTVVITDFQKQGKGQQGNSWISERNKNLTCSIILKPTFLSIKDQFLLNMIVSLSIRDFVCEKLVQRVYVKWPNDIIVEDYKICGILIENQLQGSSFSKAIVGIGLNVNQQAFYSRYASSIFILSGKQISLQESLNDILVSLEKWYNLLRNNRAPQIKDAYLQALYGFNESRSFSDHQGTFEGIISGVDELGRLMIKTKVGMRYFNTKEVQFDFEPLK